MPRNLKDNSLSQAKTISSSANVHGKLGQNNPNDLYRFDLNNPSSLNLKFRSSGQAASLRLIQDRNQNGLVDTGEVLKRTSRPSGKLSTANLPQLDTGTYFLQVSTNGHKSSDYRLTLSSTMLTRQGTQAQTASNSTPSSTLQNFVNQVVQLTNNFRAQNGLSALTLNSKLTSIAQAHSQEMALQDYFAHEGQNNSEPWDRMTAAGYKWSIAEENIAAGQQTPAEVVQAWINSPEHRANMLNANIKDIGVGYYFLANDTGNVNYHSYWTQDFGAS